MTQGGNESVDVATLLTIDVSSELRKLSRAQFEGPWQFPAELVRRALRNGATTVDVRSARHEVTLVHDGGGFPSKQLEHAAILLDPAQPNSLRHHALTQLEATGELVLLAVAGLISPQLEISSTHEGIRSRLDVRPGARPRLVREPIQHDSKTHVRLKTSDLERRKMVAWLRDVARFAPASITVDGVAITSRFERPLARRKLDEPLQGEVAIVQDSRAAQVWLLEYGILSGHVSVPDGSHLEAYVELGSSHPDLNAARLRSEIEPYLPAILEQSLALLVGIGEHDIRDETSRAGVAKLILQAVQREQQADALAQVPVFRVFHRGEVAVVSLESLRAASLAGTPGVLLALYPSQSREAFALGDQPVLIADASERSRISETLGVRFRPPDRHDRGGSWRTTWRGWLDSITESIERASSAMRGPPGPPVSPHELDGVHRAFLDGLTREIEGSSTWDIQFCRGSGPIVHRRGKLSSTVYLPLANPRVRALVQAFARDPLWLYPAVLALARDHLPSHALRQAWIQSTSPSTKY